MDESSPELKKRKVEPVVTQESPASDVDASHFSANDQSNDNRSQSQSESESESDEGDLSIETLNPKMAPGEYRLDVESVFKDYTFDEMISFLKRTFPMNPSTGDILPISEKRNFYIRKVVGHLQLRSDTFKDENVRDVMQSWLKKIREAGVWEKKIKREILRKRDGHAERDRVGECVEGEGDRGREKERVRDRGSDRVRESGNR